MEPHLIRCGRTTGFAPCSALVDALQWSRISLDAEGSIEPIGVAPTEPVLQWSRISLDAEGTNANPTVRYTGYLQWSRISLDAEGSAPVSLVTQSISDLQWSRISLDAEGSTA